MTIDRHAAKGRQASMSSIEPSTCELRRAGELASDSFAIADGERAPVLARELAASSLDLLAPECTNHVGFDLPFAVSRLPGAFLHATRCIILSAR